MPLITFDKANRQDLAMVLANEVAAYVLPWSKQSLIDSFQEQYCFYVVRHQQKIVGHVIWQTVLDESHLLNICLHPRYQGQGWGKQIMAYWRAETSAQGASVLFLEVRESNQKAIALYRALGFNQIALRKGYYPSLGNQRENGIIMTQRMGVS